MSIDRLNRAAWAAGCVMAPPAELFEEPKAEKPAAVWTPARHQPQKVEPERVGWLREMLSGWTSKAPA